MITRKKVFVLLFLALLDAKYGMSRALSGRIDFQDCGSKYEIISIDISSCDSLPCEVEKGYFITVTFEMEQRDYASDSIAVDFEVYWIVGGTQFNALVTPDMCTLGDCLSISGQRLTFSVMLYVSDIMTRTTRGTLMWRTKDYFSREVLGCARVPIYII